MNDTTFEVDEDDASISSFCEEDPLSSYSPKEKKSNLFHGMRLLRTCFARSTAGPIDASAVRRLQRRKFKIALAVLTALSIFIGLSFLVFHNDPQLLNPFYSYPLHPSYDVSSEVRINELNSMSVVYTHKVTKTEVFALLPASSENADKAFGISFRTIPPSSNGVAHVLEHSVLCGSAKYPTKDPFLHLLKGSLHTFLNAMTYPDRTVYPVATRNKADLKNLMDVYLDAVFQPRCVTDEGWWVLKQEGWRVDFDEEDPDKMEYTGVVMSEMQGVYSNPEQLLDQYIQTSLFPDNSYKYDSGGEPSVIPTLTQEDFAAFHAKYYHPSNAQVLVSGDKGDVFAALSKADAYFSDSEYRPDVREGSRVTPQAKRFTEHVRRREPYPSTNDDDGHMMTITWLLNKQPLTPLTELGLMVLDQLLLGMTSSVLRKTLTDSGLGSALVGEGLSNYLKQATFGVGMKGVADEAAAVNLEILILKTLEKVTEDGFHEDDIEGAINTVQFDLREFNTGNTPKAIEIFLTTLSKWNYDLDPRSALTFEDALTELKDAVALKGSSYFTSMIRHFLLDNDHRVIMELYPSTTLEQEQKQEEEATLTMLKTSLSPAQFQDLRHSSEALHKVQDTDDSPEVIATIPLLSLSDLDKKVTEYPISVKDDAYESGVTVVSHTVASSAGIAYVDFGLDISALNLEDATLLHFFNRMLTETGTSQLTDVELDRSIGMHTGGVSVSTLIKTLRPTGESGKQVIVSDGTNLTTKLFVRGKCTQDKIVQLFEIYSQILRSARLDSPDKAIAILKEMIADSKQRLQSRGHVYAAQRIRSRYDIPGVIGERMSGVSNIQVLSDALNMAEKNWQVLLGRLQAMRNAILGGHRGGMVLNLTGEKTVLSALEEGVESFLKNQLPPVTDALPLPDFAAVPHPWVNSAKSFLDPTRPFPSEGIIVPTAVSYVGKGGRMYDLREAIPGSSAVVSRYLQTGYMWETVRVKNGAYGAMVSLDSNSGVMVLVSYRDPNLMETLRSYDAAAQDLIQEVGTTLAQEEGSRALTSAIIGAIGKMDTTALPPDDVGWVSLNRYLKGETAALRQQWRNDILSTSLDDFSQFAHRLQSWKEPSIAVVSSQSIIEAAEKEQGSVQFIHLNPV